MNRRFLTSAVAIHAGACLIAIVSVGAGAPVGGSLVEPQLLSGASRSGEGESDQDAGVFERAPALSFGSVELTTDDLDLEPTVGRDRTRALVRPASMPVTSRLKLTFDAAAPAAGLQRAHR